MRHWKQLLTTAVIAACALTATLAATAHALPTILPESVTKWTGKNVGEIALETTSGSSFSTIFCEKAEVEGTVEQPKPLGLFHFHLGGCDVSGVTGDKCTGLGDETGTILSLGSWHLVYDHLGTALSEAGVAILFLLDNIHFVCNIPLFGNELTLVPFGAMMLCLVSSPTTLTAVFEYHCRGAKGVTEESKYYNEGGTLVSIHRLESAMNEGTEEETVVKALGTIEYPAAALLMI